MHASERWPVVLVGLPGAGKSTVGPLLAARLGVAFVDLDSEIERRESATIAELFATRGEAAFRILESSATSDLTDRRIVLAPGGGWIVDPTNAARLGGSRFVVHLRVDPSTALRRIGAHRASRPLLAGPDPEGAMEVLAARRAPAYADADAIVDTEGLSAQQVADAIAALR